MIVKTAFAELAGVDVRVLGPYAAGERDLQLDDMTKLGRALDSHVRSLKLKAYPDPLAALLDIATSSMSPSGDHISVETTSFGRQLCDGSLTGSEAQFRRLAGDYFLLRRNRYDNLVIITALTISFERGVCQWINRHKARAGMVKNVHGVVTFYGGVFYFMGLLENTSILHALSAVQAPGEWDCFAGVLLSMQGTTPMVSRAVMARTEIAYEDAETYCGQVADTDLHKFKVTNLDYLNNLCDSKGLLYPYKDF